jgi:hypothetical protein
MKKSERNEKLRIEQEERDRLHWETFKKDYHFNLLNLVFEHFNNGHDLRVERSEETQEFRFSTLEERHQDVVSLPFHLPESRSEEVVDSFERVSSRLEWYLMRRRQAEEVFRKKSAALSKLTDEERDLLGL